MNEAFTIRKLDGEEVAAAMRLAWQVFLQYEAPNQSKEGVEQFARYVAPGGAALRIESGEEVVWGAFGPQGMAGMVAVGLPSHIHLMFVKGACHRQGIARRLLEVVQKHARLLEQDSISVNSSVYAYDAYKKLGFIPTGEQIERDGIRFIPMKITL